MGEKLAGQGILGRYRHYKGGEYEVLGKALGQDATGENPAIENQRFVVYRGVDSGRLFIRPEADFYSNVAEGKPRFVRE